MNTDKVDDSLQQRKLLSSDTFYTSVNRGSELYSLNTDGPEPGSNLLETGNFTDLSRKMTKFDNRRQSLIHYISEINN